MRELTVSFLHFLETSKKTGYYPGIQFPVYFDDYESENIRIVWVKNEHGEYDLLWREIPDEEWSSVEVDSFWLTAQIIVE